nr:hypothetical protein [Thiocystis violacea]
MAILLIVTLFSLIGLRQETEGANQSPLAPTTGARFVEPRRDLFPPFSSFYFVIADRVSHWDQEAVIEALAIAPDTGAGQTWQGRFEWLPEPLVTRDIDTFQLRFLPDRQAILAREPPWSPERTERLLAELAAASASARLAPVFIVHPDGLETFVPLHERLQAAGQRFRWFAQRADEPLLLGRHPAQFTHHAIYW